MAQSSCSFATNCKTKCYFFCTCQGRQELVTINSWVRSIKKHLRDVNVSQKCVSSEKKLLLARIGLSEITKAAISRYASNIVHNLVRDSDLRVRKCQYPPHKNRRRKVEREVNLRMAEEIKAGGKMTVKLINPYCNCYLRVDNGYGRRARRALISTSVFLTCDL